MWLRSEGKEKVLYQSGLWKRYRDTVGMEICESADTKRRKSIVLPS